MSGQAPAIFATNRMSAKQQPCGFAGALVKYERANDAPLMAMLGNNVTRNYQSYKVEWEEKMARSGINYIVGADTPTGANLHIANGGFVTENTLFMVISTGEVIMVLSANDRRISVIRGFGNTPITPLNVNANTHIPILRIGTAFPEGSERVIGSHVHHFSRYNYLQIFRNGWAITRTAAMTRGCNNEDILATLKEEAFTQHVMDIELATMFGVRAYGTQQGRPLRTMDGILRQIRTNIASPANGILTTDILDYFIERVFEHSIDGASNERWAICGSGFLTMINRLARLEGNYQMDAEVNYYGLNIRRWVTPHGTINLIPHGFFNKIPGYRNDLILIHPAAIRYFYMYEGEHDNPYGSSNNGVDATVGGLISEMTVMLRGELACGWLTGICDVQITPRPIQIVEPPKCVPNDICVGINVRG